MLDDLSFGTWVKRRRKLLGLTQDRLGRLSGCSVVMIRKLEAGLRRPSAELAERLAACLSVPQHERTAFVQVATGQAPIQTLVKQLPTSLPAQLTRFVGREAELRKIYGWLARRELRLLTLVGPAGVGKTRLSLQVARNLLDYFEDGVYFVNLAEIRSPELIPAAIAEALGSMPNAGDAPYWLLVEQLQHKHCLLILDNFEQLVAGSQIVAELLRMCPWLAVLATSRQPLQLYGEQQFRVPPLSLPSAPRALELEEAQHYTAIALFVQHVRQRNDAFVLSQENLASVVDLCARLDGLPLAIELAAAHVSVWGLESLQALASSQLLWLKYGPNDIPARHQSLHAAIDWSYALLSRLEQTIFCWLSVFEGAWTTEAAVFLCADVLDQMQPAQQHARLPAGTGAGQADSDACALLPQLLHALCEKNMISRSSVLPQERFCMLTVLRQYAALRLAETGAEQAARELHARYYVSLGNRLRARLEDCPAAGCLLAAELEDIRAALRWARSQAQAELALQLAELLCVAGSFK